MYSIRRSNIIQDCFIKLCDNEQYVYYTEWIDFFDVIKLNNYINFYLDDGFLLYPYNNKIIEHLNYIGCDYYISCRNYKNINKIDLIDFVINNFHYVLDINNFDRYSNETVLMSELISLNTNDKIYDFSIDLYLNNQNVMSAQKILRWATNNQISCNILFNDFVRNSYYDNSDNCVFQSEVVNMDIATRLFIDSIINNDYYLIGNRKDIIGKYNDVTSKKQCSLCNCDLNILSIDSQMNICLCPNIKGEHCRIPWKQGILEDGTISETLIESMKLDFDKMCEGCSKQF